MAAKLSRVDALMAILFCDKYGGRSIRRHVADYRRCLRAMDVLGITVEQDRNRVMFALRYVDHSGKPYDWLEKALAS